MAAGQGFKTFTTGEVLTAADTNGYLMQGVLVFADAAARSAAITSPQEGQTSYLKDTDVIQVYSGSAWVTKSGSSPLTTKGDLYTYSTTDARLAVGTNDYVLTADSAQSTGMKWAAVPSGSKTQLATGSLSGVSSVTISSISGAYTDLILYVYGVTISPANQLWLRWNGLTSTGYAYRSGSGSSIASGAAGQFATKCQITATSIKAQQNGNVFNFEFPNYAQASMNKTATWIGGYWENGDNNQMCVGGGTFVTDSPTTGGGTPTGAITSITLLTSGGTFGAGDYILYGVK